MFQPPPGSARQEAKNRLRPKHSTQEMIASHDHCGGKEHSPVPIKCQERQRPENVKMGFNATSCEMNEQCRGQHLADGDDMPGNRAARLDPRQHHREARYDTANQYCGPDMPVGLTDSAGPSRWRN